MTLWKPPLSSEIKDGSELFFVGSDRAIQVRNAHRTGDRVQGEVVHVWKLPPGPMSARMSTGDEPSDVARREGWQEVREGPAVFSGNVADVDRVRVTQDSHIGRFLLGSLGFLAVFVGLFIMGIGNLGAAG
jgi:hypothetical protein